MLLKLWNFFILEIIEKVYFIFYISRFSPVTR